MIEIHDKIARRNAVVESGSSAGRSMWRGCRCVLKELRTLRAAGAISDICSSSLPHKLCVIGGNSERAVSLGTMQDICSSDAYLIK